MRAQYLAAGLATTDLAADPFGQFSRWFADAVADGVPEPNAMVLATADPDGRPSTRTVLLKGYDGAGFVFYTNYASRKGRELAANPHASLLFPWHAVARQVIVAGTVARVTREETEEYFAARPHGSQLGAWASQQSAPGTREELEERYARLAERWPAGEPVPAPPFWGGFRLTPRSVEFWQGRHDRLHDRLVYGRAEGGWTVTRLNP